MQGHVRRIVKSVMALAAMAVAAVGAEPVGLLRSSGVKGGLIVHLGCGDGRGTAGLRLGKCYLGSVR